MWDGMGYSVWLQNTVKKREIVGFIVACDNLGWDALQCLKRAAPGSSP